MLFDQYWKERETRLWNNGLEGAGSHNSLQILPVTCCSPTGPTRAILMACPLPCAYSSRWLKNAVQGDAPHIDRPVSLTGSLSPDADSRFGLVEFKSGCTSARAMCVSLQCRYPRAGVGQLELCRLRNRGPAFFWCFDIEIQQPERRKWILGCLPGVSVTRFVAGPHFVPDLRLLCVDCRESIYPSTDNRSIHSYRLRACFFS